MGGAVEQRGAQFLLELLDRPGQRRLRQAKLVGGTRIAAETVERVEMAEAAEVHGAHHIIPIMQYQCACIAHSVSI